VITDEDDVAEASLAEAARRAFERRLEGAFGDADGPGKTHVAGGRVDAPFGNIGDDRCDEGVAEAGGDPRREHADADVVLAEDHVRAALLRAADRDDDRRLAGLHRIAQLGPGELFDKHRRHALGQDRLPHAEAEQDGDEPRAKNSHA
jgi:hypothetical protein